MDIDFSFGMIVQAWEANNKVYSKKYEWMNENFLGWLNVG